MIEKDKQKRKCNIAIKGTTLKEKGKISKVEIERMIKDKLGVDCNVDSCKLSGAAIIAVWMNAIISHS